MNKIYAHHHINDLKGHYSDILLHFCKVQGLLRGRCG